VSCTYSENLHGIQLLQFTPVSGSIYDIHVPRNRYATVGQNQTVTQAALRKSGWLTTSLTVEYTDGGDTTLLLFSKHLQEGGSFAISQAGAGWYGVQIVFP